MSIRSGTYVYDSNSNSHKLTPGGSHTASWSLDGQIFRREFVPPSVWSRAASVHNSRVSTMSADDCFAGAEGDTETGLDYFGARYFSGGYNENCRGEQLDDFKPMPTIGRGVEEIRVADQSGAYRVIYFARRAEAVYVLHAFQKKTQATSKRDIDTIKRRFAELTRGGKRRNLKATTASGTRLRIRLGKRQTCGRGPN